MFKVEIVAIGKISQDFLKAGEKEYIKRISPYYDTKIIELQEQKLLGNSNSDISKVILEEGNRILKHLEKTRNPVFALAIEGGEVTSEGLASYLQNISLEQSGCSFIIGGSYGLSDDVKRRATNLISLSKMTFPHQIARVVLLEQIYRAATINNGITYHK